LVATADGTATDETIDAAITSSTVKMLSNSRHTNFFDYVIEAFLRSAQNAVRNTHRRDRHTAINSPV